MKAFDVTVEVSCYGQSMEVTLCVLADDEDDAIRTAEEKVRDNTTNHAGSAEEREDD